MPMQPPNDPDPKTGRRPVSSVGEVLYTENAARSSYHGLQLTANQRLSHGLSFDAYYTFAKTLVYYGVDQGYTAPTATVQDFSNIAASNGPKETELRHTMVGVFSYSLPTATAISRSGRQFLSRRLEPSGHRIVALRISHQRNRRQGPGRQFAAGRAASGYSFPLKMHTSKPATGCCGSTRRPSTSPRRRLNTVSESWG